MNSERPSCAHAYFLVGPSNNYTSLYALALMFAYMQRYYAPDFTVVCTPSVVHITGTYTCINSPVVVSSNASWNTVTLRLQMPCPHVTMVQLLPVLHKKISWRFKFSANWRATATYVGMVVE